MFILLITFDHNLRQFIKILVFVKYLYAYKKNLNIL